MLGFTTNSPKSTIDRKELEALIKSHKNPAPDKCPEGIVCAFISFDDTGVMDVPKPAILLRKNPKSFKFGILTQYGPADKHQLIYRFEDGLCQAKPFCVDPKNNKWVYAPYGWCQFLINFKVPF